MTTNLKRGGLERVVHCGAKNLSRETERDSQWAKPPEGFTRYLLNKMAAMWKAVLLGSAVVKLPLPQGLCSIVLWHGHDAVTGL